MRLRLSLLVPLLLFATIAQAQKPQTSSPPPPPPPPPTHVSTPSTSSSPSPSPAPSHSTSASPSRSSSPSPSPSHSSGTPPPSTPKSSASPSNVNSDQHSAAKQISEAAKPSNSGSQGKSSDLRRVVETGDANKPCKKQPCAPAPCPPGQSLNAKGSCVATLATRLPTVECRPSELWNGSACVRLNGSAQQCSLGQTWNGQTCVQNAPQCSSYVARAQSLLAQAQAIKDQILQSSCSSNSTTALCHGLYTQHQSVLASYQALQGQTPIACTASLPPAPGPAIP